jgi:hypothetical protein
MGSSNTSSLSEPTELTQNIHSMDTCYLPIPCLANIHSGCFPHSPLRARPQYTTLLPYCTCTFISVGQLDFYDFLMCLFAMRSSFSIIPLFIFVALLFFRFSYQSARILCNLCIISIFI